MTEAFCRWRAGRSTFMAAIVSAVLVLSACSKGSTESITDSSESTGQIDVSDSNPFEANPGVDSAVPELGAALNENNLDNNTDEQAVELMPAEVVDETDVLIDG